MLGTVAILTLGRRQPDELLLLPFTRKELAYYMLDSTAGHLHRANTERRTPWPEHADGSITTRTNDLGFREDAATPENKSGRFRILVTGDSQVDGVVNNRESFPNRLEEFLNARVGSGVFEVINGGVGYYSPQNYAGFLEKYLYLVPDVYVVVIYAGNDYLGALKHEVRGERLRIPPRPPGYLEQLEKVRAPGPVSQALNQIYFFKNYPELRVQALDLTKRELQRIAASCKADRIRLVVLLLPTKLDVEYETDGPRLDGAVATLGLTPEDLAVNRRLTEKLNEWLEGNEIEHLDLFSCPKQSDALYFWTQDHHLSSAGHEWVARVFFDTYASGLHRKN